MAPTIVQLALNTTAPPPSISHMKHLLTLSFLALFLTLTATTCYALWDVAYVTKAEAKEYGVDIRPNQAGPKDVRVEMEIQLAGKLKGLSRVDLRVGEEGKQVIATLQEDKSKPGTFVVSFVAARSQLGVIELWVMVPELAGGSIFIFKPKEFIEEVKKP